MWCSSYVRGSVARVEAGSAPRLGAGSVPRARQRALVCAAALYLALAAWPGLADQQRDPELKSVVQQAINEAECFADHYDSAVWYKLMEPRLRTLVPDESERLELIKQVYCETHRTGQRRLAPGLVMAVIAVESRFDRWAVSSAGAVGLMQVMPFWPEQLGMPRYELVNVGPNIRMGCAILRFYIQYERGDIRKALARYNGSIGRRDYPDKVISAWTRWNGADDLGYAKDGRPLTSSSRVTATP